MHMLNEKVDNLSRVLLARPYPDTTRPNTTEGPLHMPFINPSAQSAFVQPSSAKPYMPPHMRSEVLTNHVWVGLGGVSESAEIAHVDGNCVENVEGEASISARAQ